MAGIARGWTPIEWIQNVLVSVLAGTPLVLLLTFPAAVAVQFALGDSPSRSRRIVAGGVVFPVVIGALFTLSQQSQNFPTRLPTLLEALQVGILIGVVVAMGLTYSGLASDDRDVRMS
jgi:hypothetical protein